MLCLQIAPKVSFDVVKLVRLIASPYQCNDITWMVFYRLHQTTDGVVITMIVFFIGLPKLGVRYAPRFLRRILAWIFTPLLHRGFNRQLKPMAELQA